MSDEQTLLAVLAAIYLADCVYWIPINGLGFSHWAGKSWRIRVASRLIGSPRGGVNIGNPLPPLGIASRAQGWPISISPAGVFSYVSAAFASDARPPQLGVFWKWAEIKKIEREEKKIFINGAPFLTTVTEYAARHWAEEISRLHAVEEKKRPKEIELAIAASCNPGKIRTRLEEFQKKTKTLRVLCNALFVFLFGVCPYLVWRYGMVGAIWPMVIGIYTETILIALLFSKAHRKIYPLDSGQVFKPFLTMLLAAPSAIRAQDLLARPLFETFHPLAVARALDAKDEKLPEKVARDLRYPRLPEVPEGISEAAAETERSFRMGVSEALGLEKMVLKAPASSETAHALYCPRCLQQFTAKAVACAECGGRDLLPL